MLPSHKVVVLVFCILTMFPRPWTTWVRVAPPLRVPSGPVFMLSGTRVSAAECSN